MASTTHPRRTVDLLTARELALSNYPELEDRASPRLPESVTDFRRPRTFDALSEWPNFERDADLLLERLDNTEGIYFPHAQRKLLPAADEIAIRGALEHRLFEDLRYLAEGVSIPMHYVSGGSGRSLSCTDLVLLATDLPQLQVVAAQHGGASAARGAGGGDTSRRRGRVAAATRGGANAVPERGQLSHRVFGNGEAKGAWQFDLDGGENLIDVMGDVERGPAIIDCVQQLYGDMIMDETAYGFISNYNKTVFFRRCNNVVVTSLEVSPVVMASASPLKYFLYVLHEAQWNRAVKVLLPRARVPTPANLSYTLLTFPVVPVVQHAGQWQQLMVPPLQGTVKTISRKRKTRDFERGLQEEGGGQQLEVQEHEGEQPEVQGHEGEQLEDQFVNVDMNSLPTHHDSLMIDLPLHQISDLGLTGNIVGCGVHGNILEARIEGIAMVLKTFDLRNVGAEAAFYRERGAYKALTAVQGEVCPILFASGLISHCYWAFLAFSNEGNMTLAQADLRGSRILRDFDRAAKAALTSIHSCGVTHNDISRHNILIHTRSRGPLFIDFGASIVTQLREVDRDRDIRDLTLALS